MVALKIIQELSFPGPGDFFAISSIDKSDKSYRENIFQCLESDATRVVARNVHGYEYGNGVKIFHRIEWRIDNVNHLLPALGFSVNKGTES